jgi:hypothetical protein
MDFFRFYQGAVIKNFHCMLHLFKDALINASTVVW